MQEIFPTKTLQRNHLPGLGKTIRDCTKRYQQTESTLNNERKNVEFALG